MLGFSAHFAHGRRVKQVIVEQGRAVLHGGPHVDDGFQDFVVNVNQRHGGLGDVGVVGGDGGDGVATVQSLVAGQEVVAEELEAVVVVAQLVLAQRRKGHIGGGYDGADAGQRFGLADVNGLDARVGVGAAEDAPLQQAGQVQVGAVLGAARNLVHPVGTHRALADYVVLHLGKHLIGCGHFDSPHTTHSWRLVCVRGL